MTGTALPLVPLVDPLACALTFDLPLATLSVKDFRDFAEHEGLRLIRPPDEPA